MCRKGSGNQSLNRQARKQKIRSNEHHRTQIAKVGSQAKSTGEKSGFWIGFGRACVALGAQAESRAWGTRGSRLVPPFEWRLLGAGTDFHRSRRPGPTLQTRRLSGRSDSGAAPNLSRPQVRRFLSQVSRDSGCRKRTAKIWAALDDHSVRWSLIARIRRWLSLSKGCRRPTGKRAARHASAIAPACPVYQLQKYQFCSVFRGVGIGGGSAFRAPSH